MNSRLFALIPRIKRRLKLYRNRFVSIAKKLIHRPQIFEDGYRLDNHCQVTLYTDRDDLFPGYIPRVKPSESAKTISIDAVLVAVVKNEASTAREWFNCIIHQTRLPAEIVVVDTGSSDNTVALLNELSSQSPVPFRVLEAPGTNIAQGRNLAIRSTKIEYIAVTNFGTRPRTDWLERLLLPFEVQPGTEVSGGWFDAINQKGKTFVWRKWISRLGKDPQEVLSPSMSIAFTRAAWRKAGGYPEWLTLTGEDTYFDLELKRACRWWALSPEALVDWEAPASMWEYWKKMYRWSIGDGETGMQGPTYWYAAVVSGLTIFALAASLLLILLGLIFQLTAAYLLALPLLAVVTARAIYTGRRAGYSLIEVVLVMGILAAQAAGFVRGAARRSVVTRRRLKMAKGIVFILAVIPIDDTGGGSRGSQIALELLRKQYAVCYINIYPKAETIDLNLSIRHPNLITVPAGQFSLHGFTAKYDLKLSDYDLGVLVELPHAAWLPLIQELQKAGAKVVYDLIDDWDSKLGEGWYTKEVEQRIAQNADQLTATASILKDRLERLTRCPVLLLPNAVNLGLFDKRKNYTLPPGMPSTEFRIIYIGALYGNWFDWDLLIKIARAYPQASVVVIGDYRGQCPINLPNLHFLGLKPQYTLPAYLAFANVAIIPWKENEITYATSPLKLYEYLAMQVPVVVPSLPPLRDIPFVYISNNHEEFIKNIERAACTPVIHSMVEAFVLENSWEARVKQLINLFGFDSDQYS